MTKKHHKKKKKRCGLSKLLEKLVCCGKDVADDILDCLCEIEHEICCKWKCGKGHHGHCEDDCDDDHCDDDCDKDAAALVSAG